MWRPSIAGGAVRAVTALATVALTLTLVASPVAADSAPALVKDIRATGSSGPRYLVNVAGILFFSANDGIHGRELWRSNGTPAGTRIVRNIGPGSRDASPQELTAVEQTLYFTASDGVHGRELWMSDGTHDGTRMVRDITPGARSSRLSHLTRVGSRLYFGRVTYLGDEANDDIWRSDGTRAGTRLVSHLNQGQLGETAGVAGTLYFTFEHGIGLWKSHGALTAELPGTVLHRGTAYDLTAVGSTLYFGLDDMYTEPSLWKTDTSMTGATRLANHVHPAILTRFGDGLAFVARPNVGQLWVSEGTVAGTTSIADIGPFDAEYPQDYVEIAAVGDALYVANFDDVASHLWTTDGTSTGTALVRDIGAGNLTDVAGVLCFLGGVDDSLFESDGTDPGTQPVATFPSSPMELTAVGGRLYFSARDGVHGWELWSHVP